MLEEYRSHNSTDPYWEEGFDHLQRYVAEHGHAKVPDGSKSDGFNLGYWVGTQRRTKDQLPPDRLERLESLGFVWEVLNAYWLGERYLTMTELRAKLGGRSRSAIYLDLKAGRLPQPIKLGGRLYWPEGDVDVHLRALREQAA